MSVMKYWTLHLSVFFKLPSINASRIFFIPKSTKNSLRGRHDKMYRMSFTFEDTVKTFYKENSLTEITWIQNLRFEHRGVPYSKLHEFRGVPT